MKKLTKTLLVVCCIGLAAACASSPPPAELISERPYKTVQLLTVYSPAIADNLNGEKAERYVTVYLPPDYHSSDRSYPVVYFLHGYTLSVFEIVNYAPDILNSYFKKNSEEAFILVGIDGRNKYGGSFWVNSPITGNWADHAVREVPSIINAHYRTKSGPKNTGISGFSMGGFAALNLGMRHPNIFGHIYAVGPALHMEPIEPEEGMWMKAMICAFAPETILNETGRGADQVEIAHYVDHLVPDQSFCSALDQKYGISSLTELVTQYSSFNDSSQRITIEYGKYDRNRYIQIGSESFSDLLTKEGIPHKLTVFNGGHVASPRIEPSFLPFFVEGFTQE